MENRAESFLRLVRRSQRGKLKIYLGYCAGVGKTYQMLLEGQRFKEDGIDVLVGLVETHGREETECLLQGLEVIPRRQIVYRGIEIHEMDLDAIIARKPAVVLVDELAHTNVPGSRNAKRYQDVEEILAAGIHVISTLNVQHLESLYDTVEQVTGVKVRERIPDRVVVESDQIVNVDITTEDLRRRLEEGRVYTTERIETALTHFFKQSNLEQLRELTLRELAAQIDSRHRAPRADDVPSSPDQVMVCLSSRSPNSEALLRYASRLAGRLNRNWYAVYVQTSSESPTKIDSETQRVLSNALTLAQQLGATVFTYKGDDIVKTILQFAKEYRVGHVVVGRSGSQLPLWKRLAGRSTLVQRLVEEAKGNTVVVLDTREVFTFLGDDADGRRQVEDGMKLFSKALTVEMGNITLPGEGEKSQHLREVFHAYSEIVPQVIDSPPARGAARGLLFHASPLFEQIKGLAQEILEMNQANMSEANDAARSQAASAQRRMTIAILSCALVAILFSLLAQRWILDPIRRLIDSANEIRRGNLELVVNAGSRDEIGHLSEAFNAMAEGLRHTRRSDRRDLMRTRQAVSEVFKALPAAIAVLDLEDRVEVATEPAEIFFGLKPGARLKDLGYEWLTAMVRQAQDEGRIVENTAADACIQIFRDNREYFFSPVVVPIVVESGRREISGTAVILKDVTSLREQQGLKRSAVTTVSHQLRNPLTSIRMSVHLLLEEALGPLNAPNRTAARGARGERAAGRHRRGAPGPQPDGIRQDPAGHRTRVPA